MANKELLKRIWKQQGLTSAQIDERLTKLDEDPIQKPKRTAARPTIHGERITLRLPLYELERVKAFIEYLGKDSIDGVHYLKGKGRISQLIRLALQKFIDDYEIKKFGEVNQIKGDNNHE